jgi:hypothetical protein
VVECFFEGAIVRLVSGDVVISETSLEKRIQMKELSICLALLRFSGAWLYGIFHVGRATDADSAQLGKLEGQPRTLIKLLSSSSSFW